MKTLGCTFFLGVVWALAACGQSTLSQVRDYVGPNELRVTYFDSRLYAISNQEIEDVVIQVDYDLKTVATTTRPDSELPAYHTPRFDLRDGQIVTATAMLSSLSESVETRLLASFVDGEWELTLTDQELPDRPDVDGNEVFVVSIYLGNGDTMDCLSELSAGPHPVAQSWRYRHHKLPIRCMG